MHRRNARSERGFTFIELMLVLSMVILVFGVGGLAKSILGGNYWVSEDGALQCVQVVEPKAKRIVKLQRNAWSPSVVIVENSDGKRLTFTLDADILWNADCVRVK